MQNVVRFPKPFKQPVSVSRGPQPRDNLHYLPSDTLHNVVKDCTTGEELNVGQVIVQLRQLKAAARTAVELEDGPQTIALLAKIIDLRRASSDIFATPA